MLARALTLARANQAAPDVTVDASTPFPSAPQERGALPILYSFRRCPYAMRARLALAVSAQACELREVVLRNKPQALLEASPKATVPVLVTLEGQVIDQSLDIMHWALARNDPAGWLAPEVGSLEAMLGLIAQCDGDFKRHLDRYKYPGRYSDEFAESPMGSTEFSASHRTQGVKFLVQLEMRLQTSTYLFGQRAAWADMAIAPFVRQFAETDRPCFDQQPWPGLHRWLAAWLASDLFASIMEKYPAWLPGTAGVRFP